ncbi:apolipoprotein N-acyltransferase [Corallincola spongiicola]|uniref:Apolipoprotein N-acyltransferase n=1 Tax=Corallincola spongiicola TaxID=2520508 RepID=A0ABY1WMT1_9GAMM|nr:apolipoprotein N-acyltransferase [Corallincola spongiicola]
MPKVVKQRSSNVANAVTTSKASKSRLNCWIKRLRQPLLLAAAGAFSVLGFAPWSWWPTALLSMAVLAFCLHDSTPKQAFRQGYAFGLGLFAVGIAWVHISIDQFGGLPLPVSLTLMLLLAAYLSLYPALACWLSRKFRCGNPYLQILLFAACWVLGEFARGYLLTGFPWLALGYSQLDGLLSAWFPLSGVAGVSLVTAIVAGALALTVAQRQWPAAALALCTLGGSFSLSFIQFISPNGDPVDVALVQGNIEQSLRWQPDQEWPTMLKYLDLTRPHYEADLIIWPEAAVPAVEPMAQEYLDNLNYVATHNDTTVVSGIVDYNFDTRQFYNTLIVLGKQQKPLYEYRYHSANRYQKHHLLPIGEFVPFGELLRPIAPLFNLPMSSFSRGDYTQANLVANGYTIAPAICYEIAFPEQLRRSVNEQTDFLLTVSNDAWFGDSIGPQQHMEIARARAKELGRPLLRATNTGVTAAVDAYGEEIARLPMFSADVLRLPIQRMTGVTPFSQLGHWPVWLVIMLTFALVAVVQLKDRKAAD